MINNKNIFNLICIDLFYTVLDRKLSDMSNSNRDILEHPLISDDMYNVKNLRLEMFSVSYVRLIVLNP